jgi:hypothetical protein
MATSASVVIHLNCALPLLTIHTMLFNLPEAVVSLLHRQNMKDNFPRKLLDNQHNLPADTPTQSSQPGVSGQELLRCAGTISADDLLAMSDVIESDCEQVDLAEF